MNLNLSTYIQASKNISFLGEMHADKSDVILVPHVVTRTPCGNSTRLVPLTKTFPCSLIGPDYYEMSYLKPNVCYNAQNTFPSKIMKMFFYMEPYNESCIRKELEILGHDKESIDLFISMFSFLQQQNLNYSKLAQAACYILQMKFTSTLFECKVTEMFDQVKKSNQYTNMDIFFSDLVNNGPKQKSSMQIEKEIKQLFQDIKPIHMESDKVIENKYDSILLPDDDYLN